MDVFRRTLQVLCIALLAVPLSIAHAQQTQKGVSVTLIPQQTRAPGRGIYSTPPKPPAGLDRKKAINKTYREVPVKVVDGFDIKDVPVMGEPTFVRSGGKDRAPGDLESFINSNVNSTLNNTSIRTEPSLGSNGRVVFYTSNWIAGFSGDAGASWSFVDPYDNFPADGTNDVPANSGEFCCDQVVYYEPVLDLMIWFLQYTDNGTSNVQRIAVAPSRNDVLTNNWCWYDFAPGNIGYAATGNWSDFPDMATTDSHLYFTTNVFTVGADAYVGSSLVKIPLSDMAACASTQATVWAQTAFSMRLAPGHDSRMYLGDHATNQALRLSYNDSESSTLVSSNVDHTVYSSSGQGTFVATCGDGNNVAGFSDTRILAGGYSEAANAGEVLFAWNVPQGGAFAQPYVRMMRARTSDSTLLQERDIWNSTVGWNYPSVHVNNRGHWGGVISTGCGNNAGWPIAATWIVDDLNGFPDLGSMEAQAFASSDDGPDAQQWGDYNTTRKMVPFGDTWVGAGHRLNGGGDGANVVPEFVWFGRERDMPPSANRVYVEWRNNTGVEDGSWMNPHNTVNEGNTALPENDILVIFGGSYPESVFLEKASEVQGKSGDVQVGPPPP